MCIRDRRRTAPTGIASGLHAVQPAGPVAVGRLPSGEQATQLATVHHPGDPVPLVDRPDPRLAGPGIITGDRLTPLLRLSLIHI